MDRRKGLLIAAAVIAVLGTLLVVAYVRSANSRAADQYHAVKVLKVVKQISQGETVSQAQSSGAITLGEVPQNALLSGALSDLSSISNDVALTTLFPGEQVVAAKFGTSQSSTGVTIPKGMIAVSFNLTDPSRVATYVNPGNAVAVFVTASSGTYTSLVVPKAEVIAVGSTSTQPNQTTNPAQTTATLPSQIVTFAVSQKDAEKMFFAQAQGTLSLGLLNAQSEIVSGPAIHINNIAH